jgi:UDP-N-acetylglucosamine transferase subunit ALG13
MILISTGTLHRPFNRLITAGLNIFKNSSEKIIVQKGVVSGIDSYPDHFLVRDLIPYHKMLNYYQQADLIISAAGEGSVVDILRNSQYKPILFPRLKKFNEHVDNQQLASAKNLEKKGLALFAANSLQLKNIVANYQKPKLNYTQSESLHKLTQQLTLQTNKLLELS